MTQVFLSVKFTFSMIEYNFTTLLNTLILLSYSRYQKKLDQNLDFNFLRYVQKVRYKLCNLAQTNIIKSLANFLTSRITLTGLEKHRQK